MSAKHLSRYIMGFEGRHTHRNLDTIRLWDGWEME